MRRHKILDGTIPRRDWEQLLKLAEGKLDVFDLLNWWDMADILAAKRAERRRSKKAKRLLAAGVSSV